MSASATQGGHKNINSYITARSELRKVLFFGAVSLRFLANSRSRSLYAVARPSVCRLSVCNARAPYSAGCNFPQCFYGIWYLGHPLTST